MGKHKAQDISFKSWLSPKADLKVNIGDREVAPYLLQSIAINFTFQSQKYGVGALAAIW